jgi:hypothetical protein
LLRRLEIFPDMGWGLPNSAGHYLDLRARSLDLRCCQSGSLEHSLRVGEIQTEALHFVMALTQPELF